MTGSLKLFLFIMFYPNKREALTSFLNFCQMKRKRPFVWVNVLLFVIEQADRVFTRTK